MTPLLKEDLINAIRDKDLKCCLKLIKDIKLNKEICLLYFHDRQGDFPDSIVDIVASDEIENYLKEIFSTDFKVTCCDVYIGTAVVSGNIDVVKKAINLLEAQDKLESFFLSKTESYSSVFHTAALNGHERLVRFFLEKLNQEDDLIDYLNQVDLDGNTLLHYALMSADYQELYYLINQGCDLTIENNYGMTSFNLLCDRDIHQQVELFSWLNQDKKTDLLHHYRNLLIKNPANNRIQKIYFKCAGLMSLQCLLIAHHEFNEQIPIINYCTKLFYTPGFNDENSHCVLEKKEIFISEELFALMPVYEQKVITMENKQFNYAVHNFFNKYCTPPFQKFVIEKKKLQPSFLLLNKDRIKLSNLINDIDKYINLLSARQNINKDYSVLFGLILAAIMASMLYPGVTRVVHKRDIYFWAPQVLGSLALFYVCGNRVGFQRYLLNKEILAHEWDPFLVRLSAEMRDLKKTYKLPVYESRVSLFAPYFPEPLENWSAVLHSLYVSLFKQDFYLTRAIHAFKGLKSSLETIRRDINSSSGTGISFFKQSIAKEEHTELKVTIFTRR